jgi:hypothetical protein
MLYEAGIRIIWTGRIKWSTNQRAGVTDILARLVSLGSAMMLSYQGQV